MAFNPIIKLTSVTVVIFSQFTCRIYESCFMHISMILRIFWTQKDAYKENFLATCHQLPWWLKRGRERLENGSLSIEELSKCGTLLHDQVKPWHFATVTHGESLREDSLWRQQELVKEVGDEQDSDRLPTAHTSGNADKLKPVLNSDRLKLICFPNRHWTVHVGNVKLGPKVSTVDQKVNRSLISCNLLCHHVWCEHDHWWWKLVRCVRLDANRQTLNCILLDRFVLEKLEGRSQQSKKASSMNSYARTTIRTNIQSCFLLGCQNNEKQRCAWPSRNRNDWMSHHNNTPKKGPNTSSNFLSHQRQSCFQFGKLMLE